MLNINGDLIVDLDLLFELAETLIFWFMHKGLIVIPNKLTLKTFIQVVVPVLPLGQYANYYLN